MRQQSRPLRWRLNPWRTVESLERRYLLAGLLQQGDLTYEGAFRLPAGEFGASSFAYGATALAFNAANQSLFIVGHDHQQAVAEIGIPELHDGALEDLATAEVLQPFQDLIGRIPNQTLEDTIKIGGLLVSDGQLVATLYEYYDGDADAVESHFKLSSLDLTEATVSGLFRVGDHGGGYVGGYMAEVPDDWQDDFGAPYMTGLAGVAVIARSSAGPAAFGFDPAQLGGATAPTTSLLYYPYSHGGSHPDDHPLAVTDSTNRLYNTSSQIRGLVFPEDTESVLFFGSHGIGTWWYGSNGDYPDLNDPVRTSKGEHAYPYVYQVWAYDANDLRDVNNGLKEPWQVQPYDVWNYEPPFASESGHAGGVTYDPATGRIYVAQPFGDGELPVIYVYQVGEPSPDVESPVIAGLAVTALSTNSATITWQTNESADAEIEYGLTTAYGSTARSSELFNFQHTVKLAGLSPETVYHYRVRSRDRAGNDSLSEDGTFTTRSLAESLVSQLRLDEGSGSSTLDQTGRVGTIAGASWSSGKIGYALSFDGIDDLVRISHDDDLNPAQFISVAGWVRLDASGGWQTAILKETENDLSYALYASNDSGMPGFYITTSEGGAAATANVPLTVGAWTHLAGTYDGETLRLYVNGQVVAEQSASGSLIEFSGALSLGGNQVWSEFLSGRLDELRLYNVALSSAEVSALVCNVLTGDANGDGVVDLSDLNAVRNNFGQSDALGDVNCDGQVDLSDLNAVRNSFGNRLDELPGDTNDDGRVDLEDLNNVRNNFGGTGLGDTDGDRDVDLDDLNQVRNNFGTSSGAIPSPITDDRRSSTLSYIHREVDSVHFDRPSRDRSVDAVFARLVQDDAQTPSPRVSRRFASPRR